MARLLIVATVLAGCGCKGPVVVSKVPTLCLAKKSTNGFEVSVVYGESGLSIRRVLEFPCPGFRPWKVSVSEGGERIAILATNRYSQRHYSNWREQELASQLLIISDAKGKVIMSSPVSPNIRWLVWEKTGRLRLLEDPSEYRVEPNSKTVSQPIPWRRKFHRIDSSKLSAVRSILRRWEVMRPERWEFGETDFNDFAISYGASYVSADEDSSAVLVYGSAPDEDPKDGAYLLTPSFKKRLWTKDFEPTGIVDCIGSLRLVEGQTDSDQRILAIYSQDCRRLGVVLMDAWGAPGHDDRYLFER